VRLRGKRVQKFGPPPTHVQNGKRLAAYGDYALIELIASEFGVLPGFFEPLKVWSLVDAFWAMAVLRYPYCALQTPP
jgi:hypothetical protein